MKIAAQREGKINLANLTAAMRRKARHRNFAESKTARDERALAGGALLLASASAES